MTHRPRRSILILLALGLLLGAASQSASAKVVWLCQPGHRPDPCTPGLSTTVYTPTGHVIKVVHPHPVKRPAIDCFYVYPTVSDQKTVIANRQVDPEERSIALYQAARYSQYCRVFAPMYRQTTLTALLAGKDPAGALLRPGESDVRTAFETYLSKYNHGRGFILIGHSQGSFVLEQLIASEIDTKPAVRRRMLSAILLGGNVLVKRGKGFGGTFKHIPACRSATQLQCVIAFSTFDAPPPANSLFGRTTVPGDQVLCTNPAALGGGSGKLDPVSPSAPFAAGTLAAIEVAGLKLTQPHPPTVWSSEPSAYEARCTNTAGASLLQIRPLGGAQTPTASPIPAFGLHLLDASIALGNLLTVVRKEATAFATTPGAPLAGQEP